MGLDFFVLTLWLMITEQLVSGRKGTPAFGIRILNLAVFFLVYWISYSAVPCTIGHMPAYTNASPKDFGYL